MEDQNITKHLDDLLEPLAAIEHERWSHWQQYLHSKCVPQPGGSLLIPSDLVARWQTQIDTKYNELTEEEKESDREQVRKYLPLIAAAISSKIEPASGQNAVGCSPRIAEPMTPAEELMNRKLRGGC